MPAPQTVQAVALWAADLGRLGRCSPCCFPTTWRVFEDDDGVVLVIPTYDAREPGFAITITQAGDYIVLVCDPEDVDELGPFNTLKEALAGISYWLALPRRMIEWQQSLPNF
jgi:hypothetical protein